MEKRKTMVRCPKCKTMFIVGGQHSTSNKVSRDVPCHYCAEPNKVDWPEAASFYTDTAPYWAKDIDPSQIPADLKQKVLLMSEAQAKEKCEELKDEHEVPAYPKGLGLGSLTGHKREEFWEYFLLWMRLGGC